MAVEQYQTLCDRCHKPLWLPFQALTPKLCEDCYLKPRGPNQTGSSTPQLSYDRDPDASSWGNIVAAIEEDR